MDKLNFPVFKQPLPEGRTLPMEQYFEFIDMCRQYFYKRKVDDYWREKRRITQPFKLK